MTAEEIRKKIQLFVDAVADRPKVEAANAGACIMAAWMLSEIAAQLAELNTQTSELNRNLTKLASQSDWERAFGRKAL